MPGLTWIRRGCVLCSSALLLASYGAIQGCTTLYQAWRKQHQVYQPNNRTSQVHCSKQLTALQLSKSGNIQEHVAVLSELLDRLAGLNLSTHNHVRSSLLLALLPESWNTFVIALEARENALGFEGASDLILEESDCCSNRLASAHATQSALAAQASAQAAQAAPKPFRSCGIGPGIRQQRVLLHPGLAATVVQCIGTSSALRRHLHRPLQLLPAPPQLLTLLARSHCFLRLI
jgi:hypothetical protein